MDLLTVHRDVGDTGDTDVGEETSRGSRVRALTAAACWPLVTGYAAVAALLALVTAIASPSEFATQDVLLVAGPSWLATYQVPLLIDGSSLGILPLLPTVGVCLLVARSAAAAAGRLHCTTPRGAVPVIGTIAATHAVAGIAITVASNGEVLAVDPPAGCVVPALLAAASATLGVVRRCGFAAALGRVLDPLALRGLRAGALGLAALVAAGAVTLLVAMVASAPTVASLFARNAPDAGSGAGMLLLSLAYVPNALVMALGFATGTGFTLGEAALSPFGFTGGQVPGVPLLAAMPEVSATWWPVFLLLPLAAGTFVGWSLRRCHPEPLVRLRAVGVAGAVVGFGTVLVGTFAGGRLGSGAFDPVELPLGVLSVVAFGWIAVPGGLVAWLAGPRERPEVETDDGIGAVEEADGVGDDADPASDEPADDDEAADEATDEAADEEPVDDEPDDDEPDEDEDEDVEVDDADYLDDGTDADGTDSDEPVAELPDEEQDVDEQVPAPDQDTDGTEGDAKA